MDFEAFSCSAVEASKHGANLITAFWQSFLAAAAKLTDYIRQNGALPGICNLGKVSIWEIKLPLTEEAYELLTEQEKTEFLDYALSN